MDTDRANRPGPAIWAITPNGVRLGLDLGIHFKDACLFVPEKEDLESDQSSDPLPKVIRFSKLKAELTDQFSRFSEHIFIFSTGISVRLIAPLLKAKTIDPAVVVVDEKGINAISLISGHLGGANELAVEVGKATGASPVITTATDLNRRPSIDMLAKYAGLGIENPEAIKHINMKFLKGEKICVYDPMKKILPEIPGTFIKDGPVNERDYDLVCTWKEIKVSRETLILRPRVLSVGVGCNRNTPAEDILDFLKLTFKRERLSLEAVSTFATTDVKADEDGILALGKTLDRPIKFYERDRLNSVETIENPSEMAEKKIKKKSVCEAAAILGAQRGNLIVPKQKTKDVTLAVAIPE
ncbi:MAG: cobalamin biosynthesis protein [Desulfobacterales bacterium]|nr:cobalamin biosynthesis protein [Desulfobacterales bacterium]